MEAGILIWFGYKTFLFCLLENVVFFIVSGENIFYCLPKKITVSILSSYATKP